MQLSTFFNKLRDRQTKNIWHGFNRFGFTFSFHHKYGQVEPEAADPADFVIMQGYVENSNVSAIQEMIGLIEVSRAHEANQKMIQHFDQNIGKAIGTLGATQWPAIFLYF